MIYLCITPERYEKTLRIMSALKAGISAPTVINMGPPPDGAPFVVWGQQQLATKIIPQAMASGTPFWQVDNGFTNPARGGGIGYYSICYRGILPHFVAKPEKARHMADLKPWRRLDSGYVLLALPGMGFGRVMGLDMEKWVAEIHYHVLWHTDRQIRMRPKGSIEPLAADLRGAFVTVTHSSKVAVDSVIDGVPAVVAPTNPAAPVCRTDIKDIENPVYPDREEWFSTLMEQQFTLTEMRSGLAWRLMTKIARKVDADANRPVWC